MNAPPVFRPATPVQRTATVAVNSASRMLAPPVYRPNVAGQVQLMMLSNKKLKSLAYHAAKVRPEFESKTIESVLTKCRDEDLIHLTVGTEEDFRTGIRAKCHWCKFKDVKSMTIATYQISVIAPEAQGYTSPFIPNKAKGFLIVSPDAATFKVGSERGHAIEYMNEEAITDFQYVSLV